MASGKLSSRQKMINMMYLVLTALLALNVSKEILKAFHLMEVSFESVASSIKGKNESIMEGLKAKVEDPKTATRATPYMDRATKAHQVSVEFDKYLEGIISTIEKNAGGRKEAEKGETGKTELATPDDMEKHAHYFVNENHGKEIQKRINDTRIALLAFLDRDTSKGIATDPGFQKQLTMSTALYANDPKNESGHTWISMYLEHSPIAGVMAFLKKIKNDALNLESEVIGHLAGQVDAVALKFDKVSVAVVPRATNVMQGEKFQADVMLVAYNSTANPTIFMGGSPLKIEGGVGKIDVQASGIGSHNLGGYVMVPDPNTGAEIKQAWDIEYSVYAPAANVAAEKMNIFYVGLDNPVTVSVPGVPAENVSASGSAGSTVTKTSAGHFNVKVDGTQKTVTITASAKMNDKSNRSLGGTTFRIKQLPLPAVTVGPLIDGSKAVGKAELGAQSALIAGLGPQFPYEGLRYTVNSFQVIIAQRGQPPVFRPVTGNSLGSVRGLFAGLKSGDMVAITSVSVTDPKGARKTVSGPTIMIQ